MNRWPLTYNGWGGLDPSTLGLCLGAVVALFTLARFSFFRRCFLLLMVMGCVALGWRYHRPIGRMLFPMPYQETIAVCARENRLDPRMVAAVIYVESGFKPGVVSPKGAVGLMQVMPETGQWVGRQMGMAVTEESLNDSEVNIRVGTWYLRYLLDQLDQNEIMTLAAYNAGWNRIKGWIDQGVWNGRLSGIHQVPYPETRKYVTKVLRMYRIYRYLY